MFAQLKKARENNEQGFTLIEMIVVIVIIGILAAIAIPLFLNQRKSAVDSEVQSDVKNAATQVETGTAKNGSTAWNFPTPGPSLSANGTLAVGTTNVELRLSGGSTLVFTGGSNGYCIVGTNPGGDKANNGGFVYASNDGGLQPASSTRTCTNGKLNPVTP